LGKCNDVAFAYGLGAARDGFACRTDHRQRYPFGILRIRRDQFPHPADVIAVMMCDYNGTERQPALLEEAQHGLRVAWVHNSSHAAIVKCPNIIIGKRSDRLYLKCYFRRHTTLDHA